MKRRIFRSNCEKSKILGLDAAENDQNNKYKGNRRNHEKKNSKADIFWDIVFAIFGYCAIFLRLFFKSFTIRSLRDG